MPRTDTVTTTVYTFDELSDEAKEKARDKWRENHLDYEWWDAVYNWADEVFKIIGIQSDDYVKCMGGKMRRKGPDIRFSGFCSQGDGACFEGSYSYTKGAAKAIRKDYPKEEELHRIVDELQALQRRHFFKLKARVRHTGHYHHSRSVEIEVFKEGYDYSGADDVHEEVSDLMRDLMDWIYEKLEQEHDYLLSDECIDESIRSNEVEFTEDGSRY